jgi:hypothetical protein
MYSFSFVVPILSNKLTHGNASFWLVVAGIAHVIRLIGYTVIPNGHTWLILVLELLHGLTYAGTVTASTKFAVIMIPDDEQLRETAQRLICLLRGKVMTGAVLYGACLQQQIGPMFMYRRAAMVVLISVWSFGLGIFMDRVFSVSPASSFGKKTSSSPSRREADAESHIARLETGQAQRRPTLDTANYFQDRDKSDFDKEMNLTIEWENGPRQVRLQQVL